MIIDLGVSNQHVRLLLGVCSSERYTSHLRHYRPGDVIVPRTEWLYFIPRAVAIDTSEPDPPREADTSRPHLIPTAPACQGPAAALPRLLKPRPAPTSGRLASRRRGSAGGRSPWRRVSIASGRPAQESGPVDCGRNSAGNFGGGRRRPRGTVGADVRRRRADADMQSGQFQGRRSRGGLAGGTLNGVSRGSDPAEGLEHVRPAGTLWCLVLDTGMFFLYLPYNVLFSVFL